MPTARAASRSDHSSSTAPVYGLILPTNSPYVNGVEIFAPGAAHHIALARAASAEVPGELRNRRAVSILRKSVEDLSAAVRGPR